MSETGSEATGSFYSRRHIEISIDKRSCELRIIKNLRVFERKMNEREFEDAVTSALQFFPGVQLKSQQKACLKFLTVERKDVLGVLPTGFGKSLIY